VVILRDSSRDTAAMPEAVSSGSSSFAAKSKAADRRTHHAGTPHPYGDPVAFALVIGLGARPELSYSAGISSSPTMRKQEGPDRSKPDFSPTAGRSSAASSHA
jgi:hypothetical protein